jgi:hypothetical protein
MHTIFDANCMVGKSGAPRPDWPATPDETVEALRRVGIRRALVCNHASVQYDPVEGCRSLAEEVSGHPDFFAVCPAAVPDWGGDVPQPREMLDGFIRRDWRAFRIYPKAHNFVFHPLVVGPLLEEAQARRFTVLINRDQFEWVELIEVLESFPRLKLIVCSEGYRSVRTIFPMLAKFSELRFETSWLQQFLMYETVVARFGPRRLVFGTQFPRFEPGASLAPILRADISEEARACILGGNLSEMLGEAK